MTALASCSSSPAEDDADAEEGDLTQVTVGVLEIATSTPVQMAIDEGIFEEHGLDVSLEFGQGGAALLPAVSNGSIEIAIGNPLSLLTAESQGLEMSIISGYSLSYENPTDPEELAPSGIIVQEDSGIETYSDLEGKKVATNTLQTQGHLTTLAMVDDDGGDSSLVEFNEIAFP
jgi:NitT/TauT family transport system substrate-binding protein